MSERPESDVLLNAGHYGIPTLTEAAADAASYPAMIRFPQRTTTELHNVYAVTENLTKVRITGDVSWDGAIERWTRLDERLRAGERLIAEGFGAIRYFAVRSAADPHWPAGQWNHAVATVTG